MISGVMEAAKAGSIRCLDRGWGLDELERIASLLLDLGLSRTSVVSD